MTEPLNALTYLTSWLQGLRAGRAMHLAFRWGRAMAKVHRVVAPDRSIRCCGPACAQKLLFRRPWVPGLRSPPIQL